MPPRATFPDHLLETPAGGRTASDTLRHFGHASVDRIAHLLGRALWDSVASVAPHAEPSIGRVSKGGVVGGR